MKKTFYAYLMTTDSTPKPLEFSGLVEVRGYDMVSPFPEIKLFLYSDGGLWLVCEVSTGSLIAAGTSIEAARDDAHDKLTSLGLESVKAILQTELDRRSHIPGE